MSQPLDIVICNVNLVDGRRRVNVGIQNGKFVHIAAEQPGLDDTTEVVDGNGCLLSPPFVDSHFHLDAALSMGQPRFNREGTLAEGIAIWNEYQAIATVNDIKARAIQLCRWAIARGTLALRSHVDISDDRLLGVEALLEIKAQFSPFIDIQLVAFPQNGYLRDAGAVRNLSRALDRGIDFIGGATHIERTDNEGARAIRLLCELAQERGLGVDMHCDESDDPMSRHIDSLTYQTTRLGLQGRVSASHLTSMHAMDNYHVSKLLPLMAEADIQVIANPLTNILLQGRHDAYPKRRGLTRVKELLEHGINVAFGNDCVMDPWYGFGSADMLEVAHMGVHIGHMSTPEDVTEAYRAVTDRAAQAMGLEDYGLKVGQTANCVLLQAADQWEAIRLKANRLLVVRHGQIIARGEPSRMALELGREHYVIDFHGPHG